jgi:hypothetical protein
MKELQISQITGEIGTHSVNVFTGWIQTGFQKILKYQKEKKFQKTSEEIYGFCFVISITGLNRPNTGKDDDERTSSHAVCRGII